MSIWEFSTRLTRRLLVWSALSILLSTLTIFSADLFLRGLAVQFLVWGVVDGVISILGARAAARKQAAMQESDRAQTEVKEARWLSRVLWVNTGLDVFYLLGGFWLTQTWGAESPLWRGQGMGIMIQGGFLFLFDIYHAFALRNIRKS